jgi:lipopolysaccharide transport system permease protein
LSKAQVSLEHRDLIIQPHRHLLDLKLGDLWRYRDLVLLFVRRDFVSV